MGNSRAYYLQLVYMFDIKKDVKDLIECISKEDFSDPSCLASDYVEEIAYNYCLARNFIISIGLQDEFIGFVTAYLDLIGSKPNVVFVDNKNGKA